MTDFTYGYIMGLISMFGFGAWLAGFLIARDLLMPFFRRQK